MDTTEHGLGFFHLIPAIYNVLLMFFELADMRLKLGYSTMLSLSLAIKGRGSHSILITSETNFRSFRKSTSHTGIPIVLLTEQTPTKSGTYINSYTFHQDGRRYLLSKETG